MVAQLFKLVKYLWVYLETRNSHYDTLARAINSKAANLNTVLVLDRSHKRRLANDLDELLAGVSVLVDLSNITRGHGLVQRSIDSQVNTAEPRGTRQCQPQPRIKG